MPKDALPTFDKDSEQAQALRDKAEKIYHESLSNVGRASLGMMGLNTVFNYLRSLAACSCMAALFRNVKEDSI